MPWKECSVMDERLQFVTRRLAGEAMSELCREFGISRKTGYKIFDRYQECGVQGLTDRSRRPYRYGNQLGSPHLWQTDKARFLKEQRGAGRINGKRETNACWLLA
jgi:hypothetical protein